MSPTAVTKTIRHYDKTDSNEHRPRKGRLSLTEFSLLVSQSDQMSHVTVTFGAPVSAEEQISLYSEFRIWWTFTEAPMKPAFPLTLRVKIIIWYSLLVNRWTTFSYSCQVLIKYVECSFIYSLWYRTGYMYNPDVNLGLMLIKYHIHTCK